MKQIKKLIFQAVIMILLVMMPFFAWQKLVRKTRDTTEVKGERGGTTEVKGEQGSTYRDSYQYDLAPLKNWKSWSE